MWLCSHVNKANDVKAKAIARGGKTNVKDFTLKVKTNKVWYLGQGQGQGLTSLQSMSLFTAFTV
jgi:hypothetical protein